MLPKHDWINCARCFSLPDTSRFIGASKPPTWKIEQPNGSWGAREPLVVVLGFSRGILQSTRLPYDEIPFAKMRTQLTSILKVLGLLQPNDHVSNHIRTEEKDFHFGSLFRCSVSMWDKKKMDYSKSGNGILEKFLKSADTRTIAHNCTDMFLSKLPSRTKLVLLLGNADEYVNGCRKLMSRLYPEIEIVNAMSYRTPSVTFVHAIHAKAQGDYIPQWIRAADTTIGRKCRPAQEGVLMSGVLPLLPGA